MKSKRCEGLVRLVAVGLAGLWLAGCQEEPGPYLQTEMYLTPAGESEVYMGGSCMDVQQGNGMGAGTVPGTTPMFSYSYEGLGDSVRFTFLEANGTNGQRLYDAAFIASGVRDEVVVDHGDEQWRFVNWGVRECEPIREP